MKARGRHCRRKVAGGSHYPSREASLTTVVLAVVAGSLLAATTGLWCAQELQRFGPAVGGIVVFRPDPAASERWAVEVTRVDRSSVGLPQDDGRRHCVLSPGVMARAGGSLLIEARQMSVPPVFRAHWAGGRTDTGPGDCGPAADLVLQRTELMRLANSAGGFRDGSRLIGP